MKTFREQYNFWNFMFQYQPTADFYHAQFECIHHLSVVGYRFFCAVYCIFFWTLSLGFSIIDHNGYHWFKLYSSWVYIISTLFFLYAFFISFLEVCKVCKFNDSKKQQRKDRYKNQQEKQMEEIPAEGRFRSNQKLYDDIELDQPSVSSRQVSNEDLAQDVDAEEEDPLPWRFQLLWFLENLAMVNSIIATIAYWIFIRDSSENLTFNDIRSYFVIDRHGIVTFFLLVEFILNKMPWRIFHFIYPLAFGISYLIFHLVNWYYTRDNIYKFIDWKYHIGHSILYFTGAFVCIIVLQMLLFLVYRKKRH